MTDYNTLVFTFLWCDLAQELSRVQKNIQRRDLQIWDVGRPITLLCTRLKNAYSLDSQIPESLPSVTGFASYIISQFWGKEGLTGTNLLNYSGVILISRIVYIGITITTIISGFAGTST